MEEGIKNRLILILAILNVIFFVGMVSSCGSALRQKAGYDKEMAKRLEAEEKMGNFSQEMINMEDELVTKAKELEEEKAAYQSAKKALVQQQLVNESLKEEVQKVTKLKDALEEDLKEALVEGGVKK